MAIPLSFLLLFPLLAPTFVFSSPVQDPEQVVQQVNEYALISCTSISFINADYEILNHFR